MAEWAPPTLPRGVLVGAVVGYVALLTYLLVIVQQVLLGVIVGLLLGGGYLAWRFLVAIEAVADAAQRIAHERERRRE